MDTDRDDDLDSAKLTSLKFVKWESRVDPSFWMKIAELKLNALKLSEEEIAVVGEFNASRERQEQPMFVTAENVIHGSNESSSSDDSTTSRRRRKEKWMAKGSARNYNTRERFFQFSPNAEAKRLGESMLEMFKTGGIDLEESSLSALNQFTVFMHADLKAWKFYYWFLFPSISLPYEFREKILDLREEDSVINRVREEAIKEWLDDPLTIDFAWIMETTVDPGKIVVSRNHKLGKFSEVCGRLREEKDDKGIVKIEICFIDNASNVDCPSISLLNVLGLIDVRFKRTIPIDVVCVRCNKKGIFALENCLFIKGIQPLSPEILENLLVNDDEGHKQTPPQIIGWERDDANKLKPRKADLSSSMDPEKLARDAVDLNLKLMRWRQAPTLDIDAISKKKVLLIGAGTLGCSVARTLLGWGVRNMTFIDDGNVSFSNPARQSLFTFEDCLDGGKPKARAAAERLKAIVPDLNTNYVQMRVPMPGHKVPESETEDVLECIETLEREIKNADAVFILTDTRESRWLPTLLCNANNVRCYNCALGFDTYLAMRHGIPMDDETNARKGCYFCNDVVAPKDSTTDRSLDQQCTVTRPGLAQIAGALAVELFITLSEEERCLTAKSSSSIFGNDDEDSSPESNAARVPHQIRGNLRAFTQQIFDAPPFDNCVACGKNVLEQYALEKSSFLFKAFNCDEYLELASGIRDLLQNFQNSKDADLFGSCSEEDEF
jgi:ubiquitin-like modifier-activating enzyme ATG7